MFLFSGGKHWSSIIRFYARIIECFFNPKKRIHCHHIKLVDAEDRILFRVRNIKRKGNIVKLIHPVRTF